jgi:Fe-S cluster assembly protein SufD
MNEDLLFYLESRGLPEAEARAMLIQAFVGEAFECVDNEDLREAFAAVSAEWLGVQVE